jgi:hypothetical protein
MLDTCLPDLKSLKSNTTVGALLRWFTVTHKAVSQKDRPDFIDQSVETKVPYDLIRQKLPLILEDALSSLPAPYRLRDHIKNVQQLVVRLDEHIPPNEVGVWPNTKAARYEDIMNAGWLQKCRLAESPKASLDIKTLYLLILKGIELSHVQRRFGPEMSNV